MFKDHLIFFGAVGRVESAENTLSKWLDLVQEPPGTERKYDKTPRCVSESCHSACFITSLCSRRHMQHFLIEINVDKSVNIKCGVPRENSLQKWEKKNCILMCSGFFCGKG